MKLFETSRYMMGTVTQDSLIKGEWKQRSLLGLTVSLKGNGNKRASWALLIGLERGKKIFFFF